VSPFILLCTVKDSVGRLYYGGDTAVQAAIVLQTSSSFELWLVN
jgi:hypothetical protein